MRRLVFWLLLIGIAAAAAWFEFNDPRDAPLVADAPADIVVRDGDTLTVKGRDVRLYGADAPEYRQTCLDEAGRPWRCGEAARAQLVLLTAAGGVSCAPRANDRFGRGVSRCRSTAAPDLAAAMVEAGFAIDLGGYGEAPYAREQESAKRARRGIWRGRFDTPERWRAAHPRPPSQSKEKAP